MTTQVQLLWLLSGLGSDTPNRRQVVLVERRARIGSFNLVRQLLLSRQYGSAIRRFAGYGDQMLTFGRSTSVRVSGSTTEILGGP
jgi:hypothetical protein